MKRSANDLHMVPLMPLPARHLLLPWNSEMVCPFWYWITQVVLEKRPLNGCCCCFNTQAGFLFSGGNSPPTHAARQLFLPISASSDNYLCDADKVTADLAELLAPAAPDLCFVQLYSSKPFPKTASSHLPGTIWTVLAHLTSATFEEKPAALCFTSDDMQAL